MSTAQPSPTRLPPPTGLGWPKEVTDEELLKVPVDGARQIIDTMLREKRALSPPYLALRDVAAAANLKLIELNADPEMRMKPGRIQGVATKQWTLIEVMAKEQMARLRRLSALADGEVDELLTRWLMLKFVTYDAPRTIAGRRVVAGILDVTAGRPRE